MKTLYKLVLLRDVEAHEATGWQVVRRLTGHRGQVNALGARLAARVKDKLRRFEFTIVAGPTPNAFALPGGSLIFGF